MEAETPAPEFDHVDHSTPSQTSIMVFMDKERFTRISVYQGVDIRTGNWETATVCWPSIGSVPPTVAETFMRAMQFACKLASDLNDKRAGLPCEHVTKLLNQAAK